MRGIAGLAAVGLCAAPLSAAAQQLRLTVERIDHPNFSARAIELTLAGDAASARIGELRLGTHQWRNAALVCGRFLWRGKSVDCRDGRLTVPNAEPISLAFRYPADDGGIDLSVSGASLAALAKLVPELAAWQPQGKADASLHVAPTTAALQLRLSDVGFGNAPGTQAGEHLGAGLDLDAKPTGQGGWNWSARLRWQNGDVYWQPLYLQAAGQSIAASGAYADGMFRIDSGQADLGALGRSNFSGVWDRARHRLESAHVDATGVDLAQAVPTLVQPWLDQAALPKLKAAGRAAFAADYADGQVRRLDVDLAAADLAEDGGETAGPGTPAGRFALQGVTAHVPWRRDGATEGDVAIAGASVGRLPLGATKLHLSMNGEDFALAPTTIPILDGRLILDELRARRVGRDWQWQLAGSLEPVSMQRLTAQLGLPRMQGLLSASIPRIAYAGQTVSLDGALVISVFDGYLSATHLKVVEPLGRTPRLEGDLEMRHLDLGLLTETFSFGDITGFLDGDVKGLELVGWRPQRFDARLYSSPGSYRKRISQRAVQDISSIGGAGAAAAIERSFLGMFKTFGYDRIGVSCILRNGVCTMDGIEPAPQGYVIVKGGGIPALSVIGYNRQVQWDELLSRVQAVIATHGRPVIR